MLKNFIIFFRICFFFGELFVRIILVEFSWCKIGCSIVVWIVQKEKIIFLSVDIF